MLEMIEQRRRSPEKVERYDLFSSLLDANEEDFDGEPKLTDRDLLGKLTIPATRPENSRSELFVAPGNIFIFLLAGM